MNRKRIAFQWTSVGFLVIFAVFTSYFLGFTLTGTEGTILNTLAVVQGAIFAIVFSVIILGVRLSATRYSPRLASEFRADFDYKWTVRVFGISIGFAIAMLYFIDTAPEFPMTAAVMIATGLFVVAFWTLYDFVNETLEKTTPEGILTQIEEGLTSESMIRRSVKSSQEPTNPDPFLTLISVIKSTIGERDRISASIGLDILSTKISELLVSADEDLLKQEAPIDQSIKNVSVDHLPNVAEEAIGNELTQIAIEVTDTSEEIGTTAINQRLDGVLEHVLRGQCLLVTELGYDPAHERVRYEAMDSSSDLLKQAVSEQFWKGSAVGTRLLGWLSAASIANRSEGGYNRGYTSLLILCFPKLLSRTIESDDELNDHQPSQWLRAHMLDDFQSAELLIASCYSSMTELTSAAIRYELQFEQKIVRWEQVSAGWSDGMDSLSDSNLTSMRELWFGTILYIEYLSDVTPSKLMDGCSIHAIYDVDNRFAQTTADKILEGELNPRKLMDMIPGGVDPVEMPITGHRQAPVNDPRLEFNEWLENKRSIFEMGRIAAPISDKDSDEG